MPSNEELVSIRQAFDPVETEAMRDYLVDSAGKLVYVFLPRASYRVALAKDWPGASRDWGMLWKPIEAHNAEKVEIELTDGSTVGYFRGAKTKRSSDENALELRWGSDATKKPNGDPNPYWGLYTYAFDLPLEEYEEVHHGSPPAFLNGVWHPFDAVNGPPIVVPSKLLDKDDGPIGDLHGGGP